MRFLLLLATGISAFAQVPDQYTNLQVLPKNITRPELMKIMRGFSFSLGARCVACHVGNPSGALDGMDFATDSKETKKTARLMMRMVEGMNREYIGKLEPASSKRVECITCHHGLSKPRTLESALTEELDKKDLASAIALYRSLRKEYYGGAQYDFSEVSLNLLTESLQAKKKFKEAAAFMELNAEVNSLTGWGRSLLAMSHAASGDTAKAIEDFQKIVDANPKDVWAKKQLEELKAAKKE